MHRQPVTAPSASATADEDQTMTRVISIASAASLLAIASLAVSTSTAQAQSPAEAAARREANPTDVRRYDKLISDLRRLDYEYRQTLANAKNKLRDNNGKMTHVDAARLSDLRDRIDLKKSQLVSVATLCQLPVPDLENLRDNPSDGSNPGSSSASAADHDLRRANRILRADLGREARTMARTIRLPIIRRRT